jgi:hypothetical protein
VRVAAAANVGTFAATLRRRSSRIDTFMSDTTSDVIGRRQLARAMV